MKLITLIRQILRFAIIGTLVFGFEAGVLSGLMRYSPWHLYTCRIVGFMPSVCLAWWLNRRFTFISVKGLSWWRELLRYVVVNSAGSLVNLGAFFGVMHYVPMLKALPLAALAIGSLSGMFFNFIASKCLVFYR